MSHESTITRHLYHACIITTKTSDSDCACLPVMLLLPAQQLWIREDLLQSAVVADAEGEDGLSRVAGKMPGYARREGQHHLPCDLHNASGTEGEKRQISEIMLNKNLHSHNPLSIKTEVQSQGMIHFINL